MCPFCLVTSGNVCQSVQKLPDKICKISRDNLIQFYSRPSHVSCPDQPILQECGFPHMRQRQCVAFVSITFSCDLSLYLNYHVKQSGNHANQYPACNYWNDCLVFRSWAFSEAFLNGWYWELLECHKVPSHMMTSSKGNIFGVTGHLCEEFNGHRWIPRSKANDAELTCLLGSPAQYDWVNNREAGDLRRRRAHYDVIVMISHMSCSWNQRSCPRATWESIVHRSKQQHYLLHITRVRSLLPASWIRERLARRTVASPTMEVNGWLAKRPLVFNGRLANRQLTSLVEEATGCCVFVRKTQRRLVSG